MNKLLIIYYHEVVKEKGFSYQKIELEKFEEQMRYLNSQGYNTLFFSELQQPLPEKALIVSFDDGFKTVYENAAPILKKYNIKANVYLPTAFVGNNEHFMTWNMVEELCNSGLFEMQAHTHNHVDIRTLTPDELQEEIAKSKAAFTDHLNYNPVAFCMPFGGYSKKSVEAVRKIGGYRYMLSSCYGRTKESNLQNTLLPRIGISNDDTMEVFLEKLIGKKDWKGILQRARMVLFNIKGQRFDKYDF